MASLTTLPPLSERVLPDVYAEAFDEAEWFCETIERGFDDAEYTLASLARGPEQRLLGVLEILTVDAAADRAPLVEALQAGKARGRAAAFALLQLGEREPVLDAIFSDAAESRAAATRACAYLRDAELITRVSQRLDSARSAEEAVRGLEFLAACRTTPASLEAWLGEGHPGVLRAALSLAAVSEAGSQQPAIERQLGHADPATQEAAMVAGLVHHSRDAFKLCTELATPLALQLQAALGGPAEHAHLQARLGGKLLPDVLFALGCSGNLALVPVLSEYLAHENLTLAKLAFEAIAAIAGCDLSALSVNATVNDGPLPAVEEDPEARAALPLLDEDPPLAPNAVDDLAAPNPAAVSAWWASLSARPEVRHIAGQPFAAASVAAYLQHAPLRRRHIVALAQRIRSRGQLRLDTRAATSVQRLELASLAPVISNPFSSF